MLHTCVYACIAGAATQPARQSAAAIGEGRKASPDSARHGATRGASARQREEWGTRDEAGQKEEDCAGDEEGGSIVVDNTMTATSIIVL